MDFSVENSPTCKCLHAYSPCLHQVFIHQAWQNVFSHGHCRTRKGGKSHCVNREVPSGHCAEEAQASELTPITAQPSFRLLYYPYDIPLFISPNPYLSGSLLPSYLLLFLTRPSHPCFHPPWLCSTLCFSFTFPSLPAQLLTQAAHCPSSGSVLSIIDSNDTRHSLEMPTENCFLVTPYIQ